MSNWILLTSDEPLTYEKELIYERSIYRKLPSGKIAKLDFSEKFLKHILDNFLEMQEGGVKVPIYLRHIPREENRLGTVVDLTLKKNSKGKPALFLKAEFSDEKAKAQALKSDVSIGLVEEYLDGNGNEYKWAMDHVAVTDRPNVPGLEGYAAIAASLDSNFIGDIDMEELLAALELELDPAMSDEDKLKAMVQRIEDLKKASKKSEGDDAGDGGDPPSQMSGGQSLPNGDSSSGSGAPSKVTVQFSAPDTLVNQGLRVRRGLLQALLEDGKINPAMNKDLTEKHCTEKAVRLSLEQNDASFDNLVDVLEMNSASQPAKQGDEIRLSSDSLNDVDMLAKDAEAMAKGE